MPTGCFQRLAGFRKLFIDFHFKNWKRTGTGLKVFRISSIVLLLGYCIIDTIMYSSNTTEKSDVLKFIHGSRYLGLEMLMIIYASGVAAIGISVEIYLLFLYAVANCILVARNCGGTAELTRAIIWVFKVFFLFLAIELCYRNFRKLKEYEKHFNSSARVMLRQALLFSVIILFLSSPGFRTLYYAIDKSSPHLCVYEISHCGIVDLYEPKFSYDDEKCLDDLTSYIAGREELRVLRDFMLLNGVSYSVFNINFLDIRPNAKYFMLRVLLILLLVALSTSVVVSNIDPLFFIARCQLAYNIIECIIFVIIVCLLSFNLYRLRGRQPLEPQLPIFDPMFAMNLDATAAIQAALQAASLPSEELPMDPSPKVLP